jgi:acyl carrier protein
MSIILEKVQEILSHQFSLNKSEVQMETQFELELGADSRDLLEIMAAFEETFDIEIAYEDVVNIITVQDAVFYVLQKRIARDELYQNLI